MWRKLKSFIVKSLIIFLLISVGSVFVFRFIPIPVTILMMQRCGEQLWNGESLTLKKDWVSLDKMPNSIQLAVVCSEDQNFLWHHGFDFEAIKEAVKYNEKNKNRKRKKVRGASTISQQTAKNAFLFPARSFIRKGLEVYFTFLIELLWSKERIMEVYLNIIEMGDGVYGIEATSKEFFGKSCIKMIPAQSALIAAVLPNPRKYSAKNPSTYVRARQSAILRQMNLWGGKLDYDMPPISD